MYRILLTGFLPFGGESVNPSLEAVRSIQVEFPNVELIRLEVPTIFGEAERMVIEQVSFCRPHAVLCTGLASGRTAVSIERVAINVDDARIPDTAGQQPLDVPIQPHGPAAYFLHCQSNLSHRLSCLQAYQWKFPIRRVPMCVTT